ncbi:conserved hypothetical protein [methanotrophic bacterial endosymbiont of Bathymodiolus sp.]|nr:conserved hypothetical protein [methanotrophic bacterial endosymbiont of Bathymodiolus sp.]
MFLKALDIGEICTGLPHARGGVSFAISHVAFFLTSSPRPWGCFYMPDCKSGLHTVFPTPVGVFPKDKSISDALNGLPHARGGVSYSFLVSKEMAESSPRPWGCFFPISKGFYATHVFPTPVGVFPYLKNPPHLFYRLPHARGGVSHNFSSQMVDDASSPRPWGCFLSITPRPSVSTVFPTPVGVFHNSSGLIIL